MKNLQVPQIVLHPFEPVFDKSSRVLILGSLPSVKSRENNFYYGNPQNRFWRVLAKIFRTEVPVSIEEKKEFLLSKKIALWDVIRSCEISASSDSTIHNAEPNDLRRIFNFAKIEKIFANGNTAFNLYQKFFGKEIDIPCEKLPSTSPANAAWSLEKLVAAWGGVGDTIIRQD